MMKIHESSVSDLPQSLTKNPGKLTSSSKNGGLVQMICLLNLVIESCTPTQSSRCVFCHFFVYAERITDHGTGMNFWDKLDDPELAKKRVSAAKALFECLGLKKVGMASWLVLFASKTKAIKLLHGTVGWCGYISSIQ